MGAQLVALKETEEARLGPAQEVQAAQVAQGVQSAQEVQAARAAGRQQAAQAHHGQLQCAAVEVGQHGRQRRERLAERR